MYLFANDYIEVFSDDGNLKFKGYYKSVEAITRNLLTYKFNNSTKELHKRIGKKDIVKKYYIDIIGKIGGEIKCSVPFLSLKDNI